MRSETVHEVFIEHRRGYCQHSQQGESDELGVLRVAYDLHAELAEFARAMPAFDLADLAAARKTSREALRHLPGYESARPIDVTDIEVPGPEGAPAVPARLYTPGERSGLIPALLYLHGGGYCMGSMMMVDGSARMLADRAGVAVLAVEYRLAPEHPYPAGLDDAYAALNWLAGPSATGLGVDTRRIGLIGESAGGGLAAALALLVKDRGGPRLTAQFLDAPTVDDRMNTPSIRSLVDAPVWQAANQPHMWRYYLGDNCEPGGTTVPKYAAPARATARDLAGLPRAFVVAYQVDPTRDEGLNYAYALIQAGVATDVRHYAAAFHVAHLAAGTDIARRILADRIAAVRALLSQPCDGARKR
jgi:acetyl esterase